jgi:hypothetical protein
MGGHHSPGRGLMMAGAILMVIGAGVILIRTFEVPPHWMPLIVGIGLFFAGLIAWVTKRDGSR